MIIIIIIIVVFVIVIIAIILGKHTRTRVCARLCALAPASIPFPLLRFRSEIINTAIGIVISIIVLSFKVKALISFRASHRRGRAGRRARALSSR